MISCRRINEILIRIVLSFLGVIFLRRIRIPPFSYWPLLRRAGFIAKLSNRDTYALQVEWERADSFWRQGKFHQSVTLRKSILSELYELHQVSTSGYFPPFLSAQYLTGIGHQAMLGVHIAAQHLGILPRGERLAIRVSLEEPKPLLDVYQDSLRFISYYDLPGWTELPSNWHAAERLQLVRSHNEFIDLYDLIEQVFSSTQPSPTNPLFTLQEEYVAKCSRELRSLGIKEGSWFVGLHIRNTDIGNDRRNQPIDSFLPAIQEITRRGGWVIRIGDSTMARLPKLEKVIDLVAELDCKKELHPYVLANSKFVLGTSSGPSSIPPLFGVPTLITNATSIGRNILSAAANSIYLPKLHFDIYGKAMSFKEILRSDDAFGELNLEQLKARGMILRPNSPEDILIAVIEMLDSLDNNRRRARTEYDEIVEEIRSEHKWTSKGFFAESFLQKYQETFLR